MELKLRSDELFGKSTLKLNRLRSLLKKLATSIFRIDDLVYCLHHYSNKCAEVGERFRDSNFNDNIEALCGADDIDAATSLPEIKETTKKTLDQTENILSLRFDEVERAFDSIQSSTELVSGALESINNVLTDVGDVNKHREVSTILNSLFEYSETLDQIIYSSKQETKRKSNKQQTHLNSFFSSSDQTAIDDATENIDLLDQSIVEIGDTPNIRRSKRNSSLKKKKYEEESEAEFTETEQFQDFPSKSRVSLDTKLSKKQDFDFVNCDKQLNYGTVDLVETESNSSNSKNPSLFTKRRKSVQPRDEEDDEWNDDILKGNESTKSTNEKQKLKDSLSKSLMLCATTGKGSNKDENDDDDNDDDYYFKEGENNESNENSIFLQQYKLKKAASSEKTYFIDSEEEKSEKKKSQKPKNSLTYSLREKYDQLTELRQQKEVENSKNSSEIKSAELNQSVIPIKRSEIINNNKTNKIKKIVKTGFNQSDDDNDDNIEDNNSCRAELPDSISYKYIDINDANLEKPNKHTRYVDDDTDDGNSVQEVNNEAMKVVNSNNVYESPNKNDLKRTEKKESLGLIQSSAKYISKIIFGTSEKRKRNEVEDESCSKKKSKSDKENNFIDLT